MWKLAFLSFCLIFLSSGSVSASESVKDIEASAGPGEPAWFHPQGLPEKDGEATGYTFEGAVDLSNNCYAWTRCWDGRRISCWARGPACNWRTEFASYVFCESYGYAGAYFYSTKSCY
jgi:hypothetical protein